MDSNRPRPVRFHAAPKLKKAPTPRSPHSGGNRPRRPRGDEDSSKPFWIAALLGILLILVVAACFYVPQLRALFSKPEDTSETALEGPLPSKPSPPSPVLTEEQQAAQLRAKLDAEKKRHHLHPAINSPAPPIAPKLGVQSPVLLPTPKPAAPQPAPHVATKPAIPARALPLDENKLDTERIAAYQVALERLHFSCGFVDGDQGMRTQRMLRAFQQSRGLPTSGFLDPATRAAIGEPGEPFLTYTVTRGDLDSIMPKPQTWRAKAHATRLGYNNIWEMLAEKFHCTRGYLRALNPDVPVPVAGSEIIGPKVYPPAPYQHAAMLRVNLGENSIEALDDSGRIIAFFPCSIAKDKNKRPNGKLVVKSVVPDPDYTFDPALFADSAKAEGLTKKMVLPPGPRNPVGTAWIGLSLPGYGIHGTPEPENISRTQSHGCFRLANWNAEKVLRMVHVGTPVDVEP